MAQGAASHVTTQSSQLGYSVTHNNSITYISRERSTTYTFSSQIVLFFFPKHTASIGARTAARMIRTEIR